VKTHPPRVLLLMRKESPGYYSIEHLFENLAPPLSTWFEITVVRVPCHSRGLVRCVRNLIFTARLRADIIHVTGDIYYCALGISRKRCVLTVHDLVSLNRLQGLRKYVFSLLWYSLPLRWAPTVTAISDATRMQLERQFPRTRGKVEVIPDCIDEAFAGHYRIPRKGTPRPQVLQVGTGANKNLERVARAASGLPLSLRIIGPLSDGQRRLLSSLDLPWSSTAHVSAEELIAEYRDSDVLVFASTYEGFGLPIGEAQAIGLPVITSNLAPMTDTAGKGALLVDPYDEGEIRRALEQLLHSPDLARRLSDQGRRNAGRFHTNIVADQYSAVYSRALARIKPRRQRTPSRAPS
jgi:glycosyltransferase involved in cell wall biosynthesis